VAVNPALWVFPGGVFFFQSHHGFITWTCWIHYNFWVFFCLNKQGPGGSELDYLTTHTSLSPIRRGFVPGFVNYKKGALHLQEILTMQDLASNFQTFSWGGRYCENWQNIRHINSSSMYQAL
jgi:hypothetical protein